MSGERVDVRTLLEAWERGADELPATRAITLLESLGGDVPDSLGIGELAGALLDAHIRAFGTELDSVAECPGCGEPVELTVDARVLARHARDSCAGLPAPVAVQFDGVEIRVRPVTAEDLVQVESLGEPEQALLDRVVIGATRDGQPLAARDLPPGAIAAVGEALAAADPAADLAIALRCPACEQTWEESLDVAAFLWREVEAQAQRLMLQVDVLARAYGWTESEVLALGERRRGLYAEMAAG